MALTVLCVSFVVFLLLGVPVAFAIGLSCLATFAAEGLPFETAIQMMVSGMNVFSFLAIPFFIFSGELMLHGGIAALRRRVGLPGGGPLGHGWRHDSDHEEGRLQRRLRCQRHHARLPLR